MDLIKDTFSLELPTATTKKEPKIFKLLCSTFEFWVLVREYENQTNLSNMSFHLPLASSELSDCMTTNSYKSSPLIELFDEQIGICHTSVLPLQMSLTENQKPGQPLWMDQQFLSFIYKPGIAGALADCMSLSVKYECWMEWHSWWGEQVFKYF